MDNALKKFLEIFKGDESLKEEVMMG